MEVLQTSALPLGYGALSAGQLRAWLRQGERNTITRGRGVSNGNNWMPEACLLMSAHKRLNASTMKTGTSANKEAPVSNGSLIQSGDAFNRGVSTCRTVIYNETHLML